MPEPKVILITGASRGIGVTLPAHLIFAYSGKYFRSNWFPIILHSRQSVFFLFLILGLVLGLA